nr:hypothetical protein [Tanacetum cinerariifolium]
MKASLQGKDNAIRKLKEKISQMNERRSEADRILDIKSLDSHNIELTEHLLPFKNKMSILWQRMKKVKQHYKELYDSIKITRAKSIEKKTSLLTKNEKLKAQLKEKMQCVTMPVVKPKSLAPGMYAIDVEPIPPPYKNNRDVHLEYLKHLNFGVDAAKDFKENMLSDYRCQDKLMLPRQVNAARSRVKGPTSGIRAIWRTLLQKTLFLPKPDLVFHNAPNAVETVHTAFNVELSPTKPDNDLSHTHRPSALIIEDWVSDSKDEFETKLPQNVHSFVQPIKQKLTQTTARKHAPRGHYKHYANKALLNPQRHVVPIAIVPKSKLVPINAARPITVDVPKVNVTRPRQDKPIGNPQHALKDKEIIDSGCSRHITGNMSYLSDFEELNGRYVAFGGNPKGGKIFGKGGGLVCNGFEHSCSVILIMSLRHLTLSS